jgi:arginine:ornithine antiporter/lysine permease
MFTSVELIIFAVTLVAGVIGLIGLLMGVITP